MPASMTWLSSTNRLSYGAIRPACLTALLVAALDFASADDHLPALPSTATYAPPDRLRHPDVVPDPPAVQSVPAQEPGVRRARALPYALEVVASTHGGDLNLNFVNGGGAGAVFHSRARTSAQPDVTIVNGYGQPRRVTERIPAGGQLVYVVPGNAHGWYDVTVTSSADHAFVRQLAGHVEDGAPSISDPAPGQRDG